MIKVFLTLWLIKPITFSLPGQDLTSGHIRVLDGVMTIEDIVPSDGGIYSCMAVSTSVNASRDFELLSKCL